MENARRQKLARSPRQILRWPNLAQLSRPRHSLRLFLNHISRSPQRPVLQVGLQAVRAPLVTYSLPAKLTLFQYHPPQRRVSQSPA